MVSESDRGGIDVSVASPPRSSRPGLGPLAALIVWASGQGAVAGPQRPPIYERGFLDIDPRCALAQPAPGSRGWKNADCRCCPRRDRGVWADLLDGVIDGLDSECLMMDGSYVKSHPHGAGARWCHQAMGRPIRVLALTLVAMLLAFSSDAPMDTRRQPKHTCPRGEAYNGMPREC